MVSQAEEAWHDKLHVASAPSDSDPSAVYFIFRFGALRAEGGTGTVWRCTCKSRQPPHCKHLRRFFNGEFAASAITSNPTAGHLVPPQNGPKEQVNEPPPPTKRKEGMARIFTIGHGSRQLDEFLGALRAHGVTLLVDVRTFPRSRWSKQFDKAVLSKPGALPMGTSYRHMPELGGYEPDGSKELRRKDERWVTGIKWLADRAKRETIALFCMEEDSGRCHRHQTIEPDLLAFGIEVVHLPRGPKKSSSRQTAMKL